MKLSPASTNASRIENEVASSAVQPKTLPPNISGATSNSERPILRFCMISPEFVTRENENTLTFQYLQCICRIRLQGAFSHIAIWPECKAIGSPLHKVPQVFFSGAVNLH